MLFCLVLNNYNKLTLCIGILTYGVLCIKEKIYDGYIKQ